MPEPLHDQAVTSESRATTANARRRRLKHASEPDPDSGSDCAQPILRRKSRTSGSSMSRAARALMAGTGSSALESQVGGGYSPSLGRITEGKQTEARDVNSRRQRSRREFHAPAENQRQLHDRMRATLTSPSLQSVLSSLTTATSSSSGSNSTITQGSYTSGSSRRSSGMSDRRRRRRGQGSAEKRSMEQINVFNYLAPDQANNAAWSSSASSSQEDESDDDEAQEDREASRAYTPASSVTHSSSDSPIMSRKSPQPGEWPLDECDEEEREADETNGRSGSGSAAESSKSSKQPSVVDEAEAADEELQQHLVDDEINVPHQWSRRSSTSSTPGNNQGEIPQPPPPYSSGPTSLVPYTGTSPPRSHLTQLSVPPAAPEPPIRRRLRHPPALPPKSGYDLLASSLSPTPAALSQQVKPLYRRFTILNHRLLLHLQDELSELEDALLHIDAAIAHAARGGPQSRRAEAQFGNELTFHRAEILRVVSAKVAMYNNALASFSRVQAVGSTADTLDVAQYKDFVHRVRAVAEGEVAFLDADDLLALPDANTPSASPGSAPRAHQRLIAGSPSPAQRGDIPAQVLLLPSLATLLALLLVSAARSSIARLVLVAVFAAAGCACTHWTAFGAEYASPRERWMCTLAWTLVLVVFGAVAA